jgi:hypothetical protein
MPAGPVKLQPAHLTQRLLELPADAAKGGRSMTRAQLITLILGSAGIGAFVSSLVNAVANYFTKQHEFRRQDEQFALRLTELKHQQLMAVQEWAIKAEGQSRPLDFWDPLVTAINYVRGLDEFRKTGTWQKGETSHRKA